jgi:hypothetical protein
MRISEKQSSAKIFHKLRRKFKKFHKGILQRNLEKSSSFLLFFIQNFNFKYCTKIMSKFKWVLK